MTTRRDFVKNTVLAGAAFSTLPGWSLNVVSQNTEEKLRVGLIGVGLRGTNHLNNLCSGQTAIIALCDVDPKRIEIALEMMSKAGQKTPSVFQKNDYDYRNLWTWNPLMPSSFLPLGYGIQPRLRML